MGDSTDQVAEILDGAASSTTVGQRLQSGTEPAQAVPEGAEVVPLLREYALSMLEALGQAVRALAFEVDELGALHHRLAAEVQALAGRVADLEPG